MNIKCAVKVFAVVRGREKSGRVEVWRGGEVERCRGGVGILLKSRAWNVLLRAAENNLRLYSMIKRADYEFAEVRSACLHCTVLIVTDAVVVTVVVGIRRCCCCCCCFR